VTKIHAYTLKVAIVLCKLIKNENNKAIIIAKKRIEFSSIST